MNETKKENDPPITPSRHMTTIASEQPIRVPSPKVKVRMPVSTSSFNSPSGHRSWSVRKALPCLLGGVAMTLLVYRSTPAMRVRVVNKTNLKGGWRGQQGDGAVLTKKAPRPPFPTELLGTNYDVSDFWNRDGVKIPYWNSLYDLGFRREHGEADWVPPANLSDFGDDDDDYISKYLNDEDDDFFGVEREEDLPPNAAWALNGTTRNITFPGVRGDSWGPCYPPPPGVNDAINWHEVVEAFQKNSTMKYPEQPRRFVDPKTDPRLLDGMCRPGFLIIGAGKCGTSSLFHYLTSHPRVAPPIKKQIGFFTYELGRGMKWYLSHFPRVESFLASGALITGEAFPGYLPYPRSVASTARLMPGVKLIASVRDPLARAWSSYNYNYVQPALKKLRHGIGAKHVPLGKTDEFYIENHIWSFEELIRAELDVLRPCLLGRPEDDVGSAVALSRNFQFSWAKTEYRRREEEGLPPMVDYAVCYGSKVSRTVPRKQWAALVESDPGRIVDVPNLHMAQSHIGRGLYALPLEWWYAAFPRDDIHITCLEDMGVKAMDNVTSFLGLPEFDYSDVLAQGRYNVAGHKGYDKLTTLEEAQNVSTSSSDIPLSDELREEVLEFYRPFNERLFRLAGIRCPWG